MTWQIMISYLKGRIKNKGNGFIVAVVNDIGYKVFVNASLYAELEIGTEAELYTHQHVREDALDLYGFRSMGDLEMFELLLSVSGIGPKSALGVLAVAGADDIKSTIAAGDPSLLTKVSGVGKKTAERVVLELRNKVGALSGGVNFKGRSEIETESDEIDALIALGYSLMQAREALKKVDPKIKDSGERIREALKGI